MKDARAEARARITGEEDLAYELGHDGAVAHNEDRCPKSSLAVYGDAVDHQPCREQRDVCLRHVNDDPGDQERHNHYKGDRERIAPSPCQRQGQGQHRGNDGEREPMTKRVVCRR